MIFLPWERLCFLPLYLQMLIRQISTQTYNHKCRRVLQMKKKKLLKKKESEVLKPEIQHFMQKSIYLFHKLPTLWSSEVNKAILEQVKVVEEEILEINSCIFTLKSFSCCNSVMPFFAMPIY